MKSAQQGVYFKPMNAIQSISKNQLWISTRQHLLSDLVKSGLKPSVYQLKPFTTENRREFLKKFFVSRSKCDSNIEEKINEIENFLRRLHEQRSDEGSATNPLVLRMIADLCSRDKNLKLSEANQFSIYDKFTSEMVKRCLTKGADAVETVSNGYFGFLRRSKDFMSQLSTRRNLRKLFPNVKTTFSSINFQGSKIFRN